MTKSRNTFPLSALLSILLLGFLIPAKAEILLPSILSDNMVLQQNSEVKLWGWKTLRTADEIRIICSWSSDTVVTKGIIGVWSASINTPKSGGPYQIRIFSDYEEKVISNVLIGEVWLGSGQSNMEMPVDSIHDGFPGVTDYKKEISNAQFNEIRLFLVEKQSAAFPQNDLTGKWVVCTPESVRRFSGVAYFFARKLHQDLSVPVGIIASSWGGTNAETWIAKDTLVQHEELYQPFEDMTGSKGWFPNYPGELYNSMIYPLQQFRIKGVIWYQGESNRNRPESYPDVMKTLISSWRAQWGIDFPFYYTQIAPYKYTNGVHGEYMQEAQLKCLSIKNTGMVVTNDIGELESIHPKQKRLVGERLALWALAKDYNKDVEYSGPIFNSYKVKGNKMIVSFTHSDGLNSNGDELAYFEIAGEDKVFFKAKAKIADQQVVVSSPKVRKPVAVRYAFSDLAQPSLYNDAGLPASGFRTDSWPRD
jgi:sialate O-acetylesterase